METNTRHEHFDIDGIAGYRPGTSKWNEHHGGDIPLMTHQIIRAMIDVIEDHECMDNCLYDHELTVYQQDRRRKERERTLENYNVEWNPDIVF